MLDHPPQRYRKAYLYALMPDGSIEDLDIYEHVPERYVGPIVQTRVDVSHYFNDHPYMHRVPIDCARAHPDMPLTEDNLWRIVRTSTTDNPPQPTSYTEFNGMRFPNMQCICGTWWDIEGAPDAVANIVAKYGTPA